MRVDSKGSHTNLHWHNGSTCHGSPTLAACAKQAIENHWVGKILMREDMSSEIDEIVQCFSLIASDFEHHGKFGVYVAEVKLAVELL